MVASVAPMMHRMAHPDEPGTFMPFIAACASFQRDGTLSARIEVCVVAAARLPIGRPVGTWL
jgi:hypothetical protein